MPAISKERFHDTTVLLTIANTINLQLNIKRPGRSFNFKNI